MYSVYIYTYIQYSPTLIFIKTNNWLRYLISNRTVSTFFLVKTKIDKNDNSIRNIIIQKYNLNWNTYHKESYTWQMSTTRGIKQCCVSITVCRIWKQTSVLEKNVRHETLLINYIYSHKYYVIYEEMEFFEKQTFRIKCENSHIVIKTCDYEEI